tara:strand:- start:534 stop:671 length:138 start_codon:yes stop_codon:yes gene_type:complete
MSSKRALKQAQKQKFARFKNNIFKNSKNPLKKKNRYFDSNKKNSD